MEEHPHPKVWRQQQLSTSTSSAAPLAIRSKSFILGGGGGGGDHWNALEHGGQWNGTNRNSQCRNKEEEEDDKSLESFATQPLYPGAQLPPFFNYNNKNKQQQQQLLPKQQHQTLVMAVPKTTAGSRSLAAAAAPLATVKRKTRISWSQTAAAGAPRMSVLAQLHAPDDDDDDLLHGRSPPPERNLQSRLRIVKKRRRATTTPTSKDDNGRGGIRLGVEETPNTKLRRRRRATVGRVLAVHKEFSAPLARRRSNLLSIHKEFFPSKTPVSSLEVVPQPFPKSHTHTSPQRGLNIHDDNNRSSSSSDTSDTDDNAETTGRSSSNNSTRQERPRRAVPLPNYEGMDDDDGELNVNDEEEEESSSTLFVSNGAAGKSHHNSTTRRQSTATTPDKREPTPTRRRSPRMHEPKDTSVRKDDDQLGSQRGESGIVVQLQADNEKNEDDKPVVLRSGRRQPKGNSSDEKVGVSSPPHRPPNAYGFFCDKYRPIVTVQQPLLSHVEMMATISRQWKEMSALAKQPYLQSATKATAEFKHQYKAYKTLQKAQEKSERQQMVTVTRGVSPIRSTQSNVIAPQISKTSPPLEIRQRLENPGKVAFLGKKKKANNSLSMSGPAGFPKPRGRAKAGCEWNATLGKWLEHGSNGKEESDRTSTIKTVHVHSGHSLERRVSATSIPLNVPTILKSERSRSRPREQRRVSGARDGRALSAPAESRQIFVRSHTRPSMRLMSDVSKLVLQNRKNQELTINNNASSDSFSSSMVKAFRQSVQRKSSLQSIPPQLSGKLKPLSQTSGRALSLHERPPSRSKPTTLRNNSKIGERTFTPDRDSDPSKHLISTVKKTNLTRSKKRKLSCDGDHVFDEGIVRIAAKNDQSSQIADAEQSPKLNRDGRFRRPRGSAPKGKIWNEILGTWEMSKNPLSLESENNHNIALFGKNKSSDSLSFKVKRRTHNKSYDETRKAELFQGLPATNEKDLSSGDRHRDRLGNRYTSGYNSSGGFEEVSALSSGYVPDETSIKRERKSTPYPSRKPQPEEKERESQKNRRFTSDGCIIPAQVPVRASDGSFLRPRGRNLQGLTWSVLRGQWEPTEISNIKMEESKNEPSVETRYVACGFCVGCKMESNCGACMQCMLLEDLPSASMAHFIVCMQRVCSAPAPNPKFQSLPAIGLGDRPAKQNPQNQTTTSPQKELRSKWFEAKETTSSKQKRSKVSHPLHNGVMEHQSLVKVIRRSSPMKDVKATKQRQSQSPSDVLAMAASDDSSEDEKRDQTKTLVQIRQVRHPDDESVVESLDNDEDSHSFINKDWSDRDDSTWDGSTIVRDIEVQNKASADTSSVDILQLHFGGGGVSQLKHTTASTGKSVLELHTDYRHQTRLSSPK